MKRLLAICLALAAQPMAAQQVVSVQSGEHTGFTRLVLRIDPDVDWEINTSRGMAAIRFPEQALSFATGSVYDRIAKDRIASLSEQTSPEASELRLALNCDCELQSFAFDGKYIVLDVLEGPEIVTSAHSEAEAQWQPDSLPFIQPPNTPTQFTAFVMQEAPMQPRLLPDPPAKPAGGQTAPEMAVPTEPDRASIGVTEINTEIEVQDDPEMLARIDEAQDQLLAQLMRAADQGLVDFVPAPVKVVDVVEPEIVEPVKPEPPVNDSVLLQQLSARTAYEQSTEAALSEIVNQFAMPQCLEDQIFSMDGWDGGLAFSSQLALLRSALLAEFDVANVEVAEAIVQLYLRYGFGAEARLMLAEIGADIADAPLYRDMADLLEGEAERISGPVLKGAGCGGAHEMWYLASGLGDYQVLEPISITEAFSEYPIEVRNLLGPPLAHAFIARGQVDAGHIVLEIVRRANGEVTPSQRMAEAKVMEMQANFTGAEQIYGEISLSNDELAPDAMIAYARALLDAGEPVPPSLLVDLESAAFFNREANNADQLRLWEIKIRAKVEGSDRALQQISENLIDRPALGAELKAIAAEIFLQSTVDELGDYRYAQMVLQYEPMLETGASGDEARLKIAQEMASIGLPETALDILSPNLERKSDESKHVAAAAYVQLFEPRRALGLLADDPSLAAYKIRLSAYLQLEDFASVALLLNEDYAAEIETDDIALRAGDWAKIASAGNVGTLAAYMQSHPHQDTGSASNGLLSPTIDDEEPSLRATRALLVANQESRIFLEDVIADAQN